MTIIHPIPRRCCQLSPVPSRWYSKVGGQPPFFEPGADGFARDAKDSFQSPQRTTLLIGFENLFLRVQAITRRLRLLAATALTSLTPIALFAIARVSITHKLFAAAVTAFQGDSDHSLDYALSHPITPLPTILLHKVFLRKMWYQIEVQRHLVLKSSIYTGAFCELNLSRLVEPPKNKTSARTE